MLRTNIAIEDLKIKMHPFDRVANSANDESSVREWRQCPEVMNENILKNSVLPSWVIREFHWRDYAFNQPSISNLPVEYKTESGEVGRCQSHYLGELDSCKSWRPDLSSLNAQYIDATDVDKALCELQAIDVFSPSEGFEEGRTEPINNTHHGITDLELEEALVEAELESAIETSQQISDVEHVYYMDEKYYIIGDDPFDDDYCYALSSNKHPQRIAKSQIVTAEQYKEAEVLSHQFPRMFKPQDYAKLVKYIRENG
ncbi:hypothetical protein AVU32_gp384 [Vibrio phage ValKK3]|uniref:Uncharacterized protein n=1 Tax=Vibrio phage ValKK3 TaxID=1610855 RepID=A0A0D4DBG8_9CAUD|nr:hypothetical protein AVU32_gp384 [Vibrio phage ValKK3]AJT61225.1 hypothetical protein [Vibrio phage ValKK3]URQ03467.1 hypothetical protein PVA23_90 [Vibrio phage PVA23]